MRLKMSKVDCSTKLLSWFVFGDVDLIVVADGGDYLSVAQSVETLC